MRYFTSFLLLPIVFIFLISCGSHTEVKNQISTSDTIPHDLKAINLKLHDNPANANLYYERAKYYMTNKDFVSALGDMKHALVIDSTKPECYLTLADIYFFQNKTGESKIALEKCQKLDPKNMDCLMKLAELYFYVKKYDKSLSYLDEVLKVDQYNAKAYFMKGMNFKEAGDTARAISSMQTAVEQDNNYYNAYIQLGIICAGKKNKIAEVYYSNALRIQPNSPEAIYDLAKFYQDEKDWTKAIERYNQLVTINKNFFDAYYNLGVIYTIKKSYADALKYFTQAIILEPKNYRGYYGRGFCYQTMGNIQNAAADYRYVLTLNPENESAKDALKAMKIN